MTQQTKGFYVYALIDPRTGEPFYIGKGQRNRCGHHLAEARNGKSGAKCDLIRDILGSGHTYTTRIIQRFVDEREAYSAEAKLIKEIGLTNLTNACHGGGGVSGRLRKVLGDWTGPKSDAIFAEINRIWKQMGATNGSFICCGRDMTKVFWAVVGKIEADIGREEFNKRLAA